MANSLDKQLERWVSAGVVDATTAARIRTLEQSQGSGERLRWPVLLAVALGGLLLCAGVLLFVAAHWDELSPAWRFTLVHKQRSEEHTSELQSQSNLVCRLLLEKKKT